MKLLREAPQVGWLYSIEQSLAAGAEAAREMIDGDGGRELAQHILAVDPAARAEFATTEVLAAYLRARRHESRAVPTVAAPPPSPTPARASSPTARPSATTTPAVRAAIPSPGAPDAPAPLRRPTAQGQQPLRMPLAELLSRAGLPPFRFVDVGSVGAATTLRNYARAFQAMGLDPIAENPSGMTVDRTRAMAMLESTTAGELRHLLAP